MKKRAIFVGLIFVSLNWVCHAATLHRSLASADSMKYFSKENQEITEVFIENNSTKSVWVNASGDRNLLLAGVTLRLYNEKVTMEHVHIIMSNSLFSGIFFDRLVPNHTTLKVKDYLSESF